MKQLLIILVLGGIIMAPASLLAQKKRRKDTLVTIHTTFGDMTVKLYDETPIHKANFLKLAGEGFFDSTTFHRVIKDFMIQGGDPNSKDSATASKVGQGGPGYTLPAEFIPGLIHRKGVLAAARQADPVNPTRRSSGSQFYIVHGRTFTQQELRATEQRIRQEIGLDYQMSDSTKKVYMEIGGSPWLDEQYTIFGEVIEGLEVVDKVANQPVANRMSNRPKEDITITMELMVMKVKKLRKKYGVW